MGCRGLLEGPASVQCSTQVTTYAIGEGPLSIFRYGIWFQLWHHSSSCTQQMTPEEKFILLMEAAYAAPDKETYHALMQQADRILKENQVAMDHLNSEAA